MESMKIIYACSNSYVIPTYVSAYSVYQNNKNELLEFHFLVPSDLTLTNENILLNVQDNMKNLSCKIHKIPCQEFEYVDLGMQHVLHTTYYRLLIPKLFSDCEKVLYLDSDILCCGNISELYRVDLANKLVGGVIAAGYQGIRHIPENHAKRIGIPDMRSYINGGVLLMRPKEMMKQGLYDKFIKLSHKTFPVVDQDVLNVACYDKIVCLDPKYNSMTTHLYYSIEELNRVFGKLETKEMLEHPILIHYTSPKKPWNSNECIYGERWLWELERTNLISKFPSETEEFIKTIREK